ncbi:MAG: hypothetical protein GXP62_06140, partial [Oligoflexia bacterium]|nr:hypothetical protein [Oligoflexia bacterium]
MTALLSAALIGAALIGAANPALAGQVTEPPPGSQQVALLLCAGDGCPDRLFWVTHEPGLGAEPIMVVESLLAGAQDEADDDALAQRFDDALRRAHQAAVEGRNSLTRAALDDAEQALEAWHGSPDNAALFDLWFLRG